MDSSGIGIVIGRCRTLGYYNGKVFVTNVGEHQDKIFRASGVYKIVEVKEASEWKK
jgi:stage II sporulation protein AA (anti-sigma F factor antagonist)